jgi:hypothetical protein
MKTRFLFPLLLLFTASMLSAQTPAWETREPTTVRGEVSGVWGNRFTVETQDGSVLVDAGPTWYHTLRIVEGEHVEVSGEMVDDMLSAIEVTRADGEVIRVRPAERLPWAGGREAAARMEAQPAAPTPTQGSRVSDARGLDPQQLERVLAAAEGYGFVLYKEIEQKGRNLVEVEGWLEDRWEAEIVVDLERNQIISEKRKRSMGRKRGMDSGEVRHAVAIAESEGLVHLKEIELNGEIEVEGWDASGRELEVKLSPRDFRVLEVKYD